MLARDLRHARDIDVGHERRLVGEHERDLRDALGVVGHALEIDDDVQHRDDRAQIAGQRLLRGDQLEALVLDVVALLVDAQVVGDDLAGKIEVAFGERPDGALDSVVDHRAEQQHLLLDLR